MLLFVLCILMILFKMVAKGECVMLFAKFTVKPIIAHVDLRPHNVKGNVFELKLLVCRYVHVHDFVRK